jgi:hypothetical protein
MTASRDVSDDVIARPSLGGERGERGERGDIVGIDGEIDRDADVADPAVAEAAGIVEGRALDVGGELGEPAARCAYVSGTRRPTTRWSTR